MIRQRARNRLWAATANSVKNKHLCTSVHMKAEFPGTERDVRSRLNLAAPICFLKKRSLNFLQLEKCKNKNFQADFF